MKKALHKLSVRLQEEDIVTIKKYPGENISEKVRSLLAVHNTLIEDTEGKDLEQKVADCVVIQKEKKNIK